MTAGSDPPALPDQPALWDDAGDEGPREGGLDPAGPTVAAEPRDAWWALRRHTPARIALGRAGTSLPTVEVLRFAAAHAQARDAVHVALDVPGLAAALQAAVPGHPVLAVRSRATDRAEYLRRPDLGRRLDEAGRAALEPCAAGPLELVVVVADGLSARAAQAHAPAVVGPLLEHLGLGRPGGVRLGPLVLATQARVALADEIGACLGAALGLILLGERPGLASPDSLGAYLTWAPAAGRLDAQRNCVSNIRPAGLAPAAAAARLAWLVREALRRRTTGLGLRDESERALLQADPASTGR